MLDGQWKLCTDFGEGHNSDVPVSIHSKHEADLKVLDSPISTKFRVPPFAAGHRKRYSFTEKLKAIESYLAIQKVRFGNLLEVKMDVYVGRLECIE